MINFFEQINWYPAIGDPSIMGWLTVLAYFFAFILSCRVLTINKYIFARKRQGQTRLWYFIAFFMLALCVNKQLDLQSLFTAIARYFFKEYGLYEDRRNYQQLFVLFIVSVGLIMALSVIIGLYRVIQKHFLAFTGLFFLLMFVVIRAASFHHVDNIIDYRFFGVKLNWVLELSGILFISANAILLIQRKGKIKIVKKYKNRLI